MHGIKRFTKHEIYEDAANLKHSIPLTEELLNRSKGIHHKSVIKHIVHGCAGISIGDYIVFLVVQWFSL